MKKGCYISIGLIILIIFCTCCQYDPNEPEPFDPLFPYKDDPNTVGGFESSKFDGIWQVSNLEPVGPPFLDYQPMIFIFNKNKNQDFGAYRKHFSGEVLVLSYGNQEEEFLYSDTVIYTKIFRNYVSWNKTYYLFSSDGKKLTLGRNQLEKMESENWTKEDLLGSWYDGNNYIECAIILIFEENTLIFQNIWNEFYERSIDINLTDDYFSGFIDFMNFSFLDEEYTCYYYIIGDKLLLSSGRVFTRYINALN